MTRRIQGLILIGLLLGGGPVRAAEAGSAPAAHVEIASIAPARLEAIAARLGEMNRPTNGAKELGYKLAGKGKDRYRVPDKAELGIMAEIVRRRDASESFEWISEHIERRMCELDGRTYKNSAFFKRKWTKGKCWRAYRAWQEIQAELAAGRTEGAGG